MKGMDEYRRLMQGRMPSTAYYIADTRDRKCLKVFSAGN
jgi:hypothetical protein